MNSRESPTTLSQDEKNTDVTPGMQNCSVYLPRIEWKSPRAGLVFIWDQGSLSPLNKVEANRERQNQRLDLMTLGVTSLHTPTLQVSVPPSNICVYVQLNHFSVHQKLTQYYQFVNQLYLKKWTESRPGHVSHLLVCFKNMHLIYARSLVRSAWVVQTTAGTWCFSPAPAPTAGHRAVLEEGSERHARARESV